MDHIFSKQLNKQIFEARILLDGLPVILSMQEKLGLPVSLTLIHLHGFDWFDYKLVTFSTEGTDVCQVKPQAAQPLLLRLFNNKYKSVFISDIYIRASFFDGFPVVELAFNNKYKSV